MRTAQARFAVGCQSGLDQRRNSNISCRVRSSGDLVSAREMQILDGQYLILLILELYLYVTVQIPALVLDVVV